MFNGIRPKVLTKQTMSIGSWHCYDTDIHATFAFKDGKLWMMINQHKPNPAGGWYRTELARQG